MRSARAITNLNPNTNPTNRHSMKTKTLLTLAAVLLMPLAATHAVEVENLRCEYLKDPLGIDVAKPRLSWKLETGDLKPERGIKQTAYQVLVASTPELLAKDQGDLWDSGKVVGDRSIQVEYSGKPLVSGAECHWKVRVWEEKPETGNLKPETEMVTAWSKAAQFVTGCSWNG